MITLGSKLYFGLTLFALVAAMVLGLASGGTPLGVISFSWAGPVGDQVGFVILTGLGATTFFLGVVTTAFRDADPDSQAQLLGAETLPGAHPPAHLSPWPIVAAVGVAVVILGLVIEPLLFGLGLVMLAASAIEWTVTAWSDRATGDPEANRALRNRIMSPIELPAVSLFGVLIFIFFASRILLAVSKWGAIAVFGVSAVVILAVATAITLRPAVSRTVVTLCLLIGGIALVGGGFAGLVAGEREFHYLGPDGENGHHEDGDDADEVDEVDQTDPPGLGLETENDDTTAGDTEE
ncbi:MAG: hypothetical protein ACXIVQ_03770 [Acidimicrobiales bacterium]